VFLYTKKLPTYAHDRPFAIRQNQLQLVTVGAKVMARSGNDNWQLGKDLPASVVDKLAEKLAKEFNNKQFIPWYCGAIYDLGLSIIEDLQKKVQDGKDPARLFSFYVQQERRALKNKWRLDQLKGQLDD
jgi:hypothetical protein